MTASPSNEGTSPSNEGKGASPADRSISATDPAPADEYKVGPGRPPREYQFKPGQSGNPKGAKRKPRPIVLDLKACFERAFNKEVTITEGERKRIITRTEAGFEQLSIQFAKGDRHARRDAFLYAEKLGVDFMVGRRKVIEEALAADHQAILDAYVARSWEVTLSEPTRVFAPPELLDDDVEH
jgi:Family of unknown function (DUF5681)